LIGEYLREQGEWNQAAVEYMEALKIADMSVVFKEQAEVLRTQYEPLIEAQSYATDSAALDQLCQNIHEMIVRPNWRKHVTEARAQLPSAVTGALALPLAEILTQAESTEMVQAMARINQVARDGHFRTAMEDAFYLMNDAPTYLPLHIHMGEILLRQERTRAAITKFTIVAETYACRGEADRATDLFNRIVEIAPLDISARNRLIQRLIDQGKEGDAIAAYLDLADVQYRLAQLDAARSTYERALRLAQQASLDRSWSVNILHNMADIDMQRLDWRQALRVYEQLRTLGPDDEVARQNLIELNMRLGQRKQAAAELDNYLSYLAGVAKDREAGAFLEKMVKDNGKMAFVRRRLAEYYQQAARPDDAIQQWDKLAEMMVEREDMEGAKQAIRAILVLNPPNADQYRAALQRLG
jgi:tetratricopeptide (TPR) repeat protein